MLDYHGSSVALGDFTEALATEALVDPALIDARDRTLSAVGDDPGAALLGAFVHHLLGHAASDGAELALLRRSADLWAGGAGLCAQLGGIRADLEHALENPGDPGAAARFNNAAVSVQVLANTANAMRLEVDSLRADVLTFPHLPPHPRQSDQRTDQWDWGNLVLGRRTDALVRNLLRRADEPGSTAFATGALAAYGGHVAGSEYLGQASGGPRRLHRYRDRIARNAVGSWLAANHPAATTPTEMAGQITFGPAGAPELPAPLESLLRDALAETFDLARTQPLPDLQRGYRDLVAHLGLLDRFMSPEVPNAPSPVWQARLYGDPANPPPSLRPQDTDVVAMDEGGVAVSHGSASPGSTTSDSSDSKTASAVCGVIMLILILIDLAQAFVQCIGQWANENPCTFWDNMLLSALFEQDPPHPTDATGPSDPDVTAAGLTAMAGNPQVTQLIGILFDVHSQVWETMDRARVFLASMGLIYPRDLLAMPMFAQFTALPHDEVWPLREEPDPTATYHRYPVSPPENPTGSASYFPVGGRPAVFFDPNGRLAARHVSLPLWRQTVRGDEDSQNFDLDGDRGFVHAAWEANGSVHDDPIDVRVLDYAEQ